MDKRKNLKLRSAETLLAWCLEPVGYITPHFVFLIAFAEAPAHSSCINSLVISEFLLKDNRMASAEACQRFPPQSGPLIIRTRLEDGVRGDWDSRRKNKYTFPTCLDFDAI